MNKSFSFQNCIAVEVDVTDFKANTVTKTKFPRVEELAGKKVTSIEFVTTARLARGPLNQKPVISNSAAQVVSASFSIGGKNKIENLPVLCLDPASNNGNRVEIEDAVIDLEKSTINFSDSSVLPSGNATMVFLFFYKD